MKNYIFDCMRNIHEIRTALSSRRNHLFQAYPIKSMAIFGSYSREENTDDSDLDILVEFNDIIGIRFVDLADEIEEIVGLKVDLVSRNGIMHGYLKAIDPELIYV
jgi:predicted nucleotidyltransferase